MADVKISNLTALTAVADADEFVIVDSGTTKKITRKNLLGTADVTLDNNIVLTGGGTISTTSNGDIALMPNGTGKIGIGIAAPVCPLDIRHAGTGEGESIVVGNAGEGTYGGFGYDNDSPYPAIIWGAEVNIRTGSSRLSGATTRMVVDANSRISLSNNDSGGTGGTDSTSGNTLLGYLAGEDIASGGYENTLIGHGAGKNIDTGDKNVMIGSTAGDAIDGETNNVGIGYGAMGGAVNGADKCIAIGSDSLSGAITQDGTIAIGHDTLAALTSGAGNVAVGYQAGLAQTDSYYNTSIGHQANKVTDANSNTAVGYLAHQGDGSDNTAIGVLAMDNASGQADGCVAIGKDALRGDLTSAADGTVAIGMDALTALTIGAGNTAVGYEALLTATTEIGNTVIGYQAGKSIRHDASDNNVLIGYQACTGGTGSRNNSVAIGYQAWGNGGSANDLGGSENVFIGSLSGNGTWDTGASDGNTAVGYGTLIGAMNGAQLNVAVGKNVLRAVTTGDSNTSIGSNSGYTLSTGVRNVFLGNSAGYATVDVDRAVCIGYNAGSNGNMTSDADGTIAIGYNALLELTSGAGNIAIGYTAMDANQQGAYNLAIGEAALGSINDDGSGSNIAIGSYAMDGVTTLADCQHNIMIGVHAGGGSWATTASSHNVALGNSALAGALVGSVGTVAIGHSALTALTTGAGNVAVGYNALLGHTTGANNIAIGHGAMDETDGSSSSTSGGNIAIGTNSLGGDWANTGSDYNIGIGYNTLAADLSGVQQCIAMGYKALEACTTGDFNIAMGHQAMYQHTTGSRNIAIGAGAMNGTAGDADDAPASTDNVFVGYDAGGGDWADDEDSNFNVGIGNYVMDAAMDGALKNTAVGHESGTAITTGSQNALLGFQAGGAIQGGAWNTCLGDRAGDSISSGGANVAIGTTSDCAATANNQIAVGNGTVTDAANRGRWGNSSVSQNNIQTDWTVDSDVRIKKDIENSNIGLLFVNALKTRKYKKRHPSEYDAEILEARYKKGGFNYDDDKDEIIKDEFDDNKVWNGLVAQEVKTVMDDLDVEFSGWSEDSNGKQGIQYSTLVVPLIKAVQELSAQVEELKEQLENK